MRLNKYIAENTGKSRREADELISQGKVKVSSEIASLGQQISKDDKVFINNKPIENRKDHTTIILNKPVGYLSSRRTQGDNPTIYELLPKELKDLKTAGRLDKDSSGLMLLSTDGDLIQKLTHPRFKKTKIYEIKLNKELEPIHQQMISDIGVDLADGKSQLYLEKISNKPNDFMWRVTMHEGRNRQIRRTFNTLGYKVINLHRIQIGPHTLNNIESGKFQKTEV